MKFKKEILTEGLYVTGDGKGGRQVSFIPQKRIAHWASQHAKMVEAGLKVPAPELHSEGENPNKYQTEVGSKSNYGFWEQLSVGEKEEDGVVLATLNGVIDVPVEDDAKKIGNSVQETSIYAKDKFVDGTGRVWEDVLVHIAPCTKPIEPGQKNFEPVAEGDLSIAMSMSHRIAMNDMGAVGEMLNSDQVASDDLQSMLASVAGLSIPKGVSLDQLEQALLAALRQKQLSEQNGDGGSVTQPPKDSIVSQVPVVMSTNTNQGANNSAPNSIPPAPTTPATQPAASGGGGGTGEVIPPDSAATTAMSQLESQNQGLIAVATNGKKSELITRLNVLRQRGLVNDDARYKELADSINGITAMSFDTEHQPIKTEVEIEIGALEKVSIPMPANAPVVAMSQADDNGNYVIQQNPLQQTANQAPSEERHKEIMNSIFGTTNAS